MIIGIGTDIVEIDRIDKAINRTTNFIGRCFTEREIEYFKTKGMQPNVIAGNFAAKEAVSKALGTGFRGFGLLDLEILRDNLGKPFVILGDKIYNNLNIKMEYKIHVSISHSKENAIAYVIMEAV